MNVKNRVRSAYLSALEPGNGRCHGWRESQAVMGARMQVTEVGPQTQGPPPLR